MTTRRHVSVGALLMGLWACGGSGETEEAGSMVDWTGAGGASSAGGAGATTSGAGAGGGSGGGGVGGCVDPATPGGEATASWLDGEHQATVTVGDEASCTRSYQLATSAPLRDGLPDNPRTVVEAGDAPVVRTGHRMFDALYALALQEVRDNSVDSISDGAFNRGQPLPCASGGCFETGQKWTYVWTRDIAYSVSLGLGMLDPARARSSLDFKLSAPRGGGPLQIVQDTGTGGSYPVSTDRVVWALGAWEVLKYLDGAERGAFLDRALEAIVNTAEHDRAVVFDPGDGLYRGEQSFLDWREQSYPGWTATDPVQIAMSKSLGTNVGHHELLRVGAALATEKGDTATAGRLGGWADALAAAIVERLWLPEAGLFSTYLTTFLDPAPVERFDLLGSALVVLSGVASPAQAESVLERYPVLPKGPAVMWPQQQLVPIYHNRGMWPFVTAYWLRAAKHAGNHAAVGEGVRSLMRGAALNLSNMENFEAVTGAAWLDDGDASGPLVNSQRQLWSVAGYVSMVHDLVFGLEATQGGIRFSPYLPAELRTSLFGHTDRLALSRLPYRGRRLDVVVELPPVAQSGAGALAIESVRLNGVDVGSGWLTPGDLEAYNLVEISLGPGDGATASLTRLDESAIADYRNVFGPRTPTVSVSSSGGDVVVALGRGGEAAADVTFDVFRDGVQVAAALPGATASWTDDEPAPGASHCYTARSRFVGSGNASQHAAPACDWGPNEARIQVVGAGAFVAEGGTFVNSHGYPHHEAWGDADHTLTISGLQPMASGEHLLQVLYGNGAGPVSTGITCAVKHVAVKDGTTVVAEGYLVMPQVGAWSQWRSSSFVRATLSASKTYTVVISEDDRAFNMSDLAHFTLYEATGGKGGRFNRVNIAELKLLRVGE